MEENVPFKSILKQPIRWDNFGFDITWLGASGGVINEMLLENW